MFHDVRVVKKFGKEVNAITHTPLMHADEVFATAVLSCLRPLCIYRTRDREVISSSRGKILIYDVGGMYDVNLMSFDHHQRGFDKRRQDDNVLYSAAGLIWSAFGREVLETCYHCTDEELEPAFERVDNLLFRGVDARDNNQVLENDDLDAKTLSVAGAIGMFNRTWYSDTDEDKAFVRAVHYAQETLDAVIVSALSVVKSALALAPHIENNPYEEILVLPKVIGSWVVPLLQSKSPKAAKIKYVVYPGNNQWNIQAVPISLENRQELRAPFPEEWRGLADKHLECVSFVPGAIFCHKTGYFAATKDKDSAIRLAETALSWQ